MMSDSFKYIPKIIRRQHLPVFYDKYYKDDFISFSGLQVQGK